MRVLKADIIEMKYTEDYGRVEAAVNLVAKPRQGHPPQRLRILTNQPLQGRRPLEERLIEDAIRLAKHFAGPNDRSNSAMAA